jgi:hypothetical protein
LLEHPNEKKLSTLAVLSFLVIAAWLLCMEAQQIPLSELSQSKFRSATAAVTTYHGSPALKLIPTNLKDPGYVPGGPLVILNNVRFRNGAIDVDVAGAPAKGADESARGFIGVAVRVQSDTRFEIIYLRPTNSHADDQLRRNHTTQYSSDPDWPWDRLRVPVSMSRGSIWKLESGHTCGLWFMEPTFRCM